MALALLVLFLLCPSLAAGETSLHSTLGCGFARALAWERRVCFHALSPADVGEAENAAVAVRLRLDVVVRAPGAADEEWRAACYDTLRVRLWSRTALVAPRGALALPVSDCSYELEVLVPPPGVRRASYRADVRVVHIDGEGDAEPPSPRLAPANLVSFHNDGPAVWNIAARITGALHVPAAISHAGLHHDLDEGLESADVAFVDSVVAGRNETVLCTTPPCGSLPLCEGGDAPGAWRVHNSIYGDHPGAPLRFRPFTCRYERVSGPRLRRCLNASAEVLLLGESTLEQTGELMHAHAALGGFFWPAGISRAEGFETNATASLKGGAQHGLSTLLDSGLSRLRGAAARAKRPGGAPPAAYIFLQGANDAARDSLAAGAERTQRFLRLLSDGIASGDFARPTRGVVWVTAPVRHYTSGSGPGQVTCPVGGEKHTSSAEACTMAYPNDLRLLQSGQHGWTTHAGGAAVRTYGTMSRRSAFNAQAVAAFRSVFPDSPVVDFEALTAALPSDYTYDGEHWAAVWDVYRHRHGSGFFEGKSLGAAELGNILSNIICRAAP